MNAYPAYEVNEILGWLVVIAGHAPGLDVEACFLTHFSDHGLAG